MVAEGMKESCMKRHEDMYIWRCPTFVGNKSALIAIPCPYQRSLYRTGDTRCYFQPTALFPELLHYITSQLLLATNFTSSSCSGYTTRFEKCQTLSHLPLDIISPL